MTIDGMDSLKNTHDLQLGAWGPYAKKYMGLSHIADTGRGVRFDLCAAPGFYRRKGVIPNIRWECGHHPWESSADLSYFSHRHELEWKDRVVADIAFCPLPVPGLSSDQESPLRLMRCRFANNTDEAQNLVLHLFASMQYPPHLPFVARPASDAQWVDALSFQTLHFATPRPQDNLCYDGLRRGQVRGAGFVGASGIGQRFGAQAGDRVTFTLPVPKALADGAIRLRYRATPGHGVGLDVAVDGACGKRVTLPDTKENEALAEDACGFRMETVRLGALAAGEHELILTSAGSLVAGQTEGFELDGFFVGERAAVDASRVEPDVFGKVAHVAEGPVERSCLLNYAGIDQTYGLWWSGGDCEVRQFFADDLEPLFSDKVHDHVSSRFTGQGEGHYLNVFIRPVVLKPRTDAVLYALVSCADAAEAGKLLSQADRSDRALEAVWRAEQAKSVTLSCHDHARAYVPSQERMAATTLTNCVFPAYAKGRFIRHHTPGRLWDSLYTWDSGFIGLGLLECDVRRAVENLNAYVTEPGDDECAFIHHGSPVPVQLYLFQELMNRTQDRELLRFFYPRVRQYHAFLAGRLGSSDTAAFSSGLLKTWSYFYNSGGWDDYPPQHFYHHNKATLGAVAPVVNTAHAIRSAKILKQAALALGETADIAVYDAEIAKWSDALQRYSWDEEAGYFGYVLHDKNGDPRGLLRHPESGANFNMGLDGASPLVAGVCTEAQENGLFEKVFSRKAMWTPIGISTVDQSAPYYRRDGYWNGAVWMPHQWFVWKAALDAGRGEEAWQIARTGLELWKNEVDASYNCFEHFLVESGRGAGWHQFGGLSTPVLSWFGAYCVPGRLTCGLDAWVNRSEFTENRAAGNVTGLEAELTLSGSGRAACCAVVTLKPGSYRAQWNSEPVPLREIVPGTYEVRLPSQSHGVLTVA